MTTASARGGMRAVWDWALGLTVPNRDARRVFLFSGYGVGALHTLAAVVVGVWLDLVLPEPAHQGDPGHEVVVNAIAFACYIGAAFIWAPLASLPAIKPIAAWQRAGRPPTDDERAAVLKFPLRQSLVHLSVWLAALPVFVPLNYDYSPRLAGEIGSGVLLAAISTFALSYLLIERVARPLTAQALAGGWPNDGRVPGVTARLMVAWALGTGVPLLGVGLHLLDRQSGDGRFSPGPVLSLVALGLISGVIVTKLVATSIADPISSVTDALARVERDDLDVSVPVYDASEIGRLQRGVNAMAAGLRERRRLADLLGRQVGVDVARRALERGVALGGEELDAAALFVDLVGSTALAQSCSPTEVVRRLNLFFSTVVEVVDSCGGLVNKFEGDAALCIFGAPVAHGDPRTQALRAARLLADRLAALPDVEAGIGVSAGRVVAGNVGSAQRYEYTVIGDPVNEAARLCELAKNRHGCTLIAASLLDSVPEDEARHWHSDGQVQLRGRSEPTKLAELVAAG